MGAKGLTQNGISQKSMQENCDHDADEPSYRGTWQGDGDHDLGRTKQLRRVNTPAPQRLRFSRIAAKPFRNNHVPRWSSNRCAHLRGARHCWRQQSLHVQGDCAEVGVDLVLVCRRWERLQSWRHRTPT